MKECTLALLRLAGMLLALILVFTSVVCLCAYGFCVLAAS